MNILIGGVVAVTLLIPQLVASITPIDQSSGRESQGGITLSGDSDEPSIQQRDEEEILWFARALYSETKDADEMELIAWVIRNRVENKYWGDTTYKDVVLRPKQFSGLNKTDKQYSHNVSLTFNDDYTAWRTAVSIATYVYYDDGSHRPFDSDVQHFYSPHVIHPPHWAEEHNKVFTTENNTFAFYQGVR